ncbi:Rhomboid-like protein [Beggiatoa sp. PS]|nr:Rhomboid-like protein [Beggiatoa sp. PS]
MASLNCPHCHHHLLEPVRHDNVELDACVHCGGLWFDRNELDKVVRTYDPDYPHEGPIVENLGQKREKTQKQCPHCQEVLTTHQIKQGRELKIDVCHLCHGVWLEKGELDYAKLFYEIPEAVERIQKEPTWKQWLFQLFLGLPIEFNIKARKFPLITVILIVLNGLAMLVFAINNSISNSREMFQLWGLVHLDTFHDFLTLFTYQFLHNGWAHFIGNMYFLWKRSMMLAMLLIDITGKNSLPN